MGVIVPHSAQSSLDRKLAMLMLTVVSAAGAASSRDACVEQQTVAQCMSSLDAAASKQLVLCCAKQHAADTSIQYTAITRLYDSYRPLTYEEIYLAQDAPLIVSVGEVCLAALHNHADNAPLQRQTGLLLRKLGLDSLSGKPIRGGFGASLRDRGERLSSVADSTTIWSGAAILAGALALGAYRRPHRSNSSASTAGAPTWALTSLAFIALESSSSADDCRRKKRRHRAKQPGVELVPDDDPPAPATPAPPAPIAPSLPPYDVHEVDATPGATSPAIADEGDDTLDADESCQCVVCWEAPRSHACVPCGHRCLCSSPKCTAHLTRCPMCRMEVERVMRVWG